MRFMFRVALVPALVGFLLSVAACGASPTRENSPTSPNPITPTIPTAVLDAQPPAFRELAGIWKGFLRVTEATIGSSGSALPFTLRISGDPESYAGQFEVTTNYGLINVDVSGKARGDGFAALSGSRTVAAWDITAMDVTEFIVKPDALSGLSGSVRFARRTPIQFAQFSGEILSASLQLNGAYPGGPLEGHWIGEGIIRGCTGYCSGAYSVNSRRPIELVLKQAGSVLSGDGSFGSDMCGLTNGCVLPLNGAAEGNSIVSLSGRATHDLAVRFAGDRVMMLSDFSATVDSLGRMQAKFVYASDGRQWAPVGPPKLSNVTSRLVLESVWLSREP